jgi:transglutaminase-like putative cysteine protease
MADLLISYANEDRGIASDLAKLLEEKGFVIYDAVGSARTKSGREIEGQIDQAKAVLVIWTERSIVSDWVLAEVQRAYYREKLICLRHSQLAPDRVPLPYNALHCIDIHQADELLDALRQNAIHPTLAEQTWRYYDEAPVTRERVVRKFMRIADSYSQTRGRFVKDPSLDLLIEHDTLYDYDRPIEMSLHTVRLHPTLKFDNFRNYSLVFSEPPDVNLRACDLFDNVIRRVIYTKPMRSFHMKVAMIVNLTPVDPFTFRADPSIPIQYTPIERLILEPYMELEDDANHPSFFAFAADAIPQGTVAAGSITDLLTYVHTEIANEYHPSLPTAPGLTIAEVLSRRKGTAGNRSRVLVNLLRHHGFAARYVSGYMIEFPEWLMDTDANWEVYYSGWAQAYLPNEGWIGLDPLTGLVAQQNFVPLACGPSLSDTAAIEGSTEACEVSLKVRARAAPISRALCFD